jgi:DNA-binding GntR family transcriptional regulator
MAFPSSSPESTLALLQKRSLASAAQEEIEKLILSGELAAGTRIGEAEMALRLGVSRGPIREAFRGLEEVGLVRFETNRGVFVRELDIAEAEQNYVVRGALEALAGRLLAARITDGEIAELRGIGAQMKEAVAQDDAARYAALNLGLHRRIFEMAGNRKLIDVYGRITKELTLFRRHSVAPEVTLREHIMIVNKIAARDRDGAAAALLAHVENSRRRIVAAYSSS